MVVAALLASACNEFTAADAEAVRGHVLAIEEDLEEVPWCGTVRLYRAQQIAEFGEAGWQVAIQSSVKPEVIRSLRASLEQVSQNSDV